MTRKGKIEHLQTGVRNLDAILDGGLPKGIVSVLGGAPGSGKTILAQQICFHLASPERRVVYFSTLSEPTAKTLRYLAQFDYFDARRLERDFQFVDLGGHGARGEPRGARRPRVLRVDRDGMRHRLGRLHRSDRPG